MLLINQTNTYTWTIGNKASFLNIPFVRSLLTIKPTSMKTSKGKSRWMVSVTFHIHTSLRAMKGKKDRYWMQASKQVSKQKDVIRQRSRDAYLFIRGYAGRFHCYLARALINSYVNNACSILNTFLQYGILNHHVPTILSFTVRIVRILI